MFRSDVGWKMALALVVPTMATDGHVKVLLETDGVELHGTVRLARCSGHERDTACCLLGNRPGPTNASRALLLDERAAQHRPRRTLDRQSKGGENERRMSFDVTVVRTGYT